MSNTPNEGDLLVEFEIENLPDDYREYYRIKRNNFFATIQKLPDLWAFFCKIDQIWSRELSDLGVGVKTEEAAFPLMLYINAHSKIRISAELAFAQCLQESRSLLRDAVESVAHAHHMLRDHANLMAWLQKDTPGGKASFKKAFEKNKATVLFKGLEELHEKYGQLSEAGSHPTPQSFHNKISFQSTEAGRSMALKYTGASDERSFALELFSRLLTCYVMERALFNDYRARLELDPELAQMCNQLERFKEQLRRTMITRYKVARPLTKP